MILVAICMRNTLASLIVFALSISVWNPNVSAANDEGQTLRIMTYNIHHCEGVDGKLDVERIAGVIRKQECDLVALQEVDRNTTRSQRVDQLAKLGRLTGLQPYFGKAIDFGGGEYGLGILSRLPIQETKIMQLPSGSNREKRIVIEVVVQPETGPRFVFACTHLDHSFGENDRTQQINELKKRFGGGPSQAILAGDFNCTSDKTELAPILTYWSDVDSQKMSPTIPVAKPNRKIDYIFLQHDCPWSVDSAQVLDEPVASDHLPLVSTLRLVGGTRETVIVEDESEKGSTRGIIDFKRPKDAIQLVGPNGSAFVPENPELDCKWAFDDGVLTASPKWDSVLTPESYRDFRMHVEFSVNNALDLQSDMNGNSGVYIQQRYELQILNSFGVPHENDQAIVCGSIYQQKKPDQLVSKPAGEWQSFDIVFRAARFDGERKTQNARITVFQNGQLIHDDYPLKRKTGAGKKESPEALPIKLQGHHNQVRFRNVWIQTLSLETPSIPENELWLTYKGADGPGKRKRVVLIAAEQEYRCEQAMPMLAKVLSEHHGFDCTVLFSVNENGEVDPTLPAPNKDKTKFHNIPGLEQLAKADCVIWISRFMYLPDEQMKFFHDYFDSGKPLIALRTANHGFMGGKKYIVKDRNIGLQELLGGTFMEHHGGWHRESTRGIIVPENKSHPILIGIKDIWGTSDVYRCHNEKNPFPADCIALVMGQPLINLQPDAPANETKESLPVAWTKTWTGNNDRESRIFHFTMGSAEDFANEGVRRMTVNSVYWGLGMESDIEPDRSVAIVGQYQPLAPGFNYEELGVKPQKPSFYK